MNFEVIFHSLFPTLGIEVLWTRALFAGEKRLVQSCVPVVKTRDSPSLYLTDGSKIEVFW